MKKVLTLVLALALVVSMFAFANADTANLSVPGELPIWQGEGTPVITILCSPNTEKVSDWDDNEYTKWIEENTGVDLQFKFLPAVDAKEKLSLMVNSGEKLPDVVLYGLSMAEAMAFCDAGAIVDVAPYYEAGLAYNVDAAVAAYPDMNLLTNITAANGGIYSVPKIQVSPSNETKYKMWINEGWLENLGLEVPTTTDEFYEMLKAFKEKDANGNGNPDDEIPFDTTVGFGGTAYKYLTNAFVFEGDNDLFMLKDGHVTFSYLQDEWYDACLYIRKLFDEGLITPESLTQSNNDLLPVVCSDDDIVGALTNSSCAFMGNPGTETHDKYRLRYICIAPLAGPEGVQYTAYAQSTTGNMWHVTSYCENPELAFRVGDFQFTEEGFLRGRFGLENENWMTKENYLAAHPEQTVLARYSAMGAEGKYVFYNDVRETLNNLYWYDPMPYFAGDVETNGCYVADDGNGTVINLDNNGTCRQETATGVYQNYKPGMDVYVPTLAYTADEIEEISEIQATVKEYVKQQRAAFYLGEKSDLEDFEAFKEILFDTYELQTFIDIADAAYQRQYAAD